MSSPLFSLSTADHCFDVQFHPNRSLLAAATITGEIELHSFELQSEMELGSNAPEPKTELLRKISGHKDSCRTARFLNPERLASAAASKVTAVTDIETSERIWKAKLGGAGNSLLVLPGEGRFVVGDDDGCVKVFDIRQKKPTVQYSENEDFISDMTLGVDGHSLCATSGDGTLAVYDLRKNGEKGLVAMSDFQEDEFLSVAIVKEGKKVICGSQIGILAIFTWGDFGDQKDRVNGHPMSVDAMVKLSEDALLTGSSDGKIRVVAIHHKEFGNCIVGSLGEHGEYPLEHLALSPDGKLIASASHSQPAVRIWSSDRAHKLLADFEDRGENKDEAANACAADSDVDSDDSDAPSRKKKKRKKGVAKRQAVKASKSASTFFNDL